MKAFEHISDERIQAFLDAELSQEEMARVQAHAASCGRCESEIDAWRLLFEELGELPTLEPSVHLVDHVIGALPERAPIGLRLPEWIKEERTISQTDHLVAARLQDYIDGALTRDGRVRADAHLAGCISCRDELSGWSQLFGSIGDLSELAPSHDFAERIMQRVRVRAPVPAASEALTMRARRWVSGWSLAAARGMVPAQLARLAPRSRRAWAAVASLAAAPTIAAAAVIFMIFSHPLLTPGYLASFLWWKASAATGAVGSWIAAASVQASEGVLETGLVQALTASAGGLVMTGIGLSALMAASLWVVYRNLFAPSTTDRYARISL